MNIAFMLSGLVIMLMAIFLVYLYRTEKVKSPFTRTIVMVVTMMGSFYVGMILKIMLSSLLMSMVAGVIAGLVFIVMMSTDFEDFLHGFMQSLMGGMMGGMLSGMIPSEDLLKMVQMFSLFVFLLFYVSLYITGAQHRLIKQPIYMAVFVILFGILLYQIEIPSSVHLPHHG